MNTSRAEQLFKKYLKGQCTADERRLVEDWYLETYKKSADSQVPDLDAVEAQLLERLPMLIGKRSAGRRPFRQYWKKGFAAAAILLMLLSVGIYIYLKPSQAPVRHSGALTAAQISPGKNTAILTLSDGTEVDLSEDKHGIVSAGDEMRYEDGSPLIDQAPAPDRLPLTPSFYQMRTPRGGQYQVQLPDGTKVWLNAASSLEYPARFTGPQREVSLSGEAYFEVAKNGKPFIAKTADQRVEVLGTHFNVSAYQDETQTRTTLLEGAVKVYPGNKTEDGEAPSFRILQPSQQSVVGHGGAGISVRAVNTQKEVAWKNGDFIFDREDLPSIMRKVSRWYNIDVVIQGRPSEVLFSGAVSRKRNLSAVLEMLELTTDEITFKLEEVEPGGTERRLIVMM